MAILKELRSFEPCSGTRSRGSYNDYGSDGVGDEQNEMRVFEPDSKTRSRGSYGEYGSDGVGDEQNEMRGEYEEEMDDEFDFDTSAGSEETPGMDDEGGEEERGTFSSFKEIGSDEYADEDEDEYSSDEDMGDEEDYGDEDEDMEDGEGEEPSMEETFSQLAKLYSKPSQKAQYHERVHEIANDIWYEINK